jgi:hypothetical protein
LKFGPRGLPPRELIISKKGIVSGSPRELIISKKGIVSGSFEYKIQTFKEMCRNEQQNVILVTSIKKGRGTS